MLQLIDAGHGCPALKYESEITVRTGTNREAVFCHFEESRTVMSQFEFTDRNDSSALGFIFLSLLQGCKSSVSPMFLFGKLSFQFGLPLFLLTLPFLFGTLLIRLIAILLNTRATFID